MHWLIRFAENYSGSGDVDQFNIADGTEESNSAVQDPKNNGGVYQDNEYYPATMPYSLDVHDSQNSQAEKDKPNPSRSDEYSDFPFSEQAVDDNHANSVASLNLNMHENDIAGGGANFLHNAPDSPKILEDGHPLEELEEGEGVNFTFNNTLDKARPTDGVMLEDPSMIETNPDKIDSTPEINKGRTLVSNKLNPFGRTAREVWVDNSGSNVDEIEYPDELERKHRRSTEDFGTKDQTGNEQDASSQPYKGYSGDEYENSLYSGIQPSAGQTILNNYIRRMIAISLEKAKEINDKRKFPVYCEKCGKRGNDLRGRLCDKCAFKKEADFTQVMPDANPNSGRDEADDSDGLLSYIKQPHSMSDGKMNGGNMADKVDYDNNLNRKKRIYQKTEDTENYFSSENSGGGYGAEGDGQNFSGIQPGE
jgi:hypothetical protein